jgi:hypothetical protein
MRKFISFEINTFKNVFSISKRSFDKFDEWKQRKLFFQKRNLFSLFNDLIFQESEIISLFFSRTFCLDILIVTKMLIVDADSSSDDDVSSNVDNWKISIDDEIFFFIIDFETIFFREFFNTCFHISILSYYFSSLFSNICSEIACTLHKIFFLLSWKNRQLRTCRKISFHWIWRRDNHLRRLSLNFRFERYWWNHILSNIWWKLEISFFHFFECIYFFEMKTFCNQTFWNE